MTPSRRVAVITGAGSGIGAALAEVAASRGMVLVLADVDKSGLERTRKSCGGEDTLVIETDVSDAAAVEQLAEETWWAFGRVDLLCNNAGVVPGGRHRAVWEYSPEDWRWAFEVNVFGVANGLRSFVPRLIAQGSGHVLNTASVSGFISGAGSPIYGATKHAVVRLTEALYASIREQGHPIRVTMLCPGLVNTPFFDAERVRPAALRNKLVAEEAEELKDIAKQGADPLDIAQEAFRAIDANRFYAFTTDRFDETIASRTQEILSRCNPRFGDFHAMSRKDARHHVASDPGPI